jgi:hypothetical protein
MTDTEKTLAALTLMAEEVKRLGEKATPGAWRHRKSVHGSKYRYVQVGADESYTTLELLPADAAFIAQSRTAAPLLASAVLALVEVARAADTLLKLRSQQLAMSDDYNELAETLSALAPGEE